MKNTILLAIAFIFLISFTAHSQEIDMLNKNSVQLELGGHGMTYSIHYERILLTKGMFNTSGQIGLSHYPISIGLREPWFPVALNEIISFYDRHHIEVGIGTIFFRDTRPNVQNTHNSLNWISFLSGRLGYRYQAPNSRLIFRIGFTPLIESPVLQSIPLYKTNNRLFSAFHRSAAIALGYSF